MHTYVDSHTHLFDNGYKDDLDDVLKRSIDAGVKYCVVPGTDLKTSGQAIDLADRYTGVYACVGIHPHEAARRNVRDLLEIEMLLTHPKVVAIGEIGLDYHYEVAPRKTQQEIFLEQLQMAVQHNVPVVVHTREAMPDVIPAVQSVIHAHPDWKGNKGRDARGVFHCFPGTGEEGETLSRLGFFLSYPGIITFKNATSADTIRQIGIQKILLETDSPYMAPVPFRGKRNEPAFIRFIAAKIAEILSLSEEDVARITTENSIHVFGLPEDIRA